LFLFLFSVYVSRGGWVVESPVGYGVGSRAPTRRSVTRSVSSWWLSFWSSTGRWRTR